MAGVAGERIHLDLGVFFAFGFSRNAQCNMKTKTMQVVHAFYFLLTLHLIVHDTHEEKKTKKGSHRKATHTKADPALLTNEKKGRNATQGVPRHPRERSGWTTTRTTAQICQNSKRRQDFYSLLWRKLRVFFVLLFSHGTTLWNKNDLRAKHVWQIMGKIG